MARCAHRLATWLSGLLTCCLVASIYAQQPVRAQLDSEYRLIAPQPVATGNQIEVIEFFWYGCPYCYELEPALDAWLKRKPADVVLRRIPAVFRPNWMPQARIYYTLEALGAAERLHRAVYDSYHMDQLATDSADKMAEWAGSHGLDREQWLAAYNSPEVERKVELARELTARYQIRGTPSLVVDGRYLTSSAMTPRVPAVIPVLEDLIVLARERRHAN
jgi:protein dithiol oxidoreductase (disulfide-forming)